MSRPAEGGFRRLFGEVYQYQWVYGDGSIDLVAEISKFIEVGAALSKELGMEHLNIDGGGFRLFRPLNPTEPIDTLVLIERYDDIRVWAAGEYAAQTSAPWMQAVLANQDNESSWLGEASMMLDDALSPPNPIDSDLIAMDWVTFDPTKKVAMVDMPQLVQELADAVDAAGFDQTAVRYFGMNTIAGPYLNHAHLIIEHASPAILGEVLAWRQTAPELADWRTRIRAVCGSIRSHTLLTQVA